jgi:arylsulfatase A-like enzyme
MPTRRPNVVVLCTDQQRYDSLGCNGNRHALTPHLDRFAAENTNFRRHITANPVCMPSRASFVTGRYPSGHGVWINGVALPRVTPDVEACVAKPLPTMADVFAAAGYHTRSMGKLHFTPHKSTDPNHIETYTTWKDPKWENWHGPYYGFEHVTLSLAHGEGAGGHYKYWLKQNYPEIFKRVSEHQPARPFKGEVGQVYAGALTVESHHSTWLASTACEFIAEQNAGSQPFFLYLNFPDPHHPYTPPEELARRFESHDCTPEYRGDGVRGKPSAYEQMRRKFKFGENGVSPECARLVRQYTDAMNHLIDASCGRIFDALKKQNLWDDTIVIFTSDHGDFLGDFGLMHKGYVGCNALNHVPFLMRAPGANLPAECSAPMSNADVFPTLCELLKIDAPAGVQGSSILGSARGDAPRLAPVYAYDSDETTNFSVYDERFRFTCFPRTGERELYDHRDDPGELRNRAGDRALAADESRLMQSLLEIHMKADRPALARICEW